MKRLLGRTYGEAHEIGLRPSELGADPRGYVGGLRGFWWLTWWLAKTCSKIDRNPEIPKDSKFPIPNTTASRFFLEAQQLIQLLLPGGRSISVEEVVAVLIKAWVQGFRGLSPYSFGILFHHHFLVPARVPGLVSLLFWHPVPSSFPGSG